MHKSVREQVNEWVTSLINWNTNAERNQKETPASGWNFLSLLTRATARALPGVGSRRHLLGSRQIFWSGLFPASIASASFLSLASEIDRLWLLGRICPATCEQRMFFIFQIVGVGSGEARIAACKMWKLHEIKNCNVYKYNFIYIPATTICLHSVRGVETEAVCPTHKVKKYFLSGPLWEKFVNPWTRRALGKGFEVYSQ